MALSASGNFCRRFGTALRAGMELLRLLEMESRQGSQRQRAAMRNLHDGAKRGELLSSLMEAEKPFFPPLVVAMTRVGEATGRMDRTLLALADHYDHRVTMRRSFITSIAWPGLQLFAGIGVLSLLIWLLGVLTPAGGGEMTDTLGLGLRGGSGVLIFWSYLAVFFGTIAAMIWGYKNNVGGVQNIVPLVYMIPVAGPAIQTIAIARFAWTLSLCLDSGLDPIQSIHLALDSTDNEFYCSAADGAEASIRGGMTLAETLRNTDLFPEDFVTNVDVAEMSGTDAESIDILAKDYDTRAKTAIKTLAGIATALIWLTVSGALIFIILRMAMNIAGVYSEALKPI